MKLTQVLKTISRNNFQSFGSEHLSFKRENWYQQYMLSLEKPTRVALNIWLTVTFYSQPIARNYLENILSNWMWQSFKMPQITRLYKNNPPPLPLKDVRRWERTLMITAVSFYPGSLCWIHAWIHDTKNLTWRFSVLPVLFMVISFSNLCPDILERFSISGDSVIAQVLRQPKKQHYDIYW